MNDRITGRAYTRPHRPWPLRIGHAAVRGLGLADRPILDADRLIAEAIAAEGLHDLGPPDLNPLPVLLHHVDTEARLHPLGRATTAGRVRSALRTRLRATAWLQRHPEQVTTPMPPPVVITGLQRTGTTLLHRLLAAHPDLRALRSWEALSPAPALTPSRLGDPRRAQARVAEAGLRWLAPDFFAVHPVEHDSPEEDVLLLDHSFLSTVPEATMNVPGFSAWLEAQDHVPAYRTLDRLLRVLSLPGPPARWVLKTPHHLEWLDALWSVFPDAVVVMTHRDPVTTLGSFCSMVAHGHGILSDAVDPHEIGRHWLRKTGRMVDRAMAARAARPGQVIDVDYADLMRDPVGEVRRITAFAGLRTADHEVSAAMAAMPKDRYGKHAYDLADFGLTPTMVADRFAAYRSGRWA